MKYLRLVLFSIILATSIADHALKFHRGKCHDFESVCERIIGGEISPQNRWPWVAALLSRNTSKFIGGGSLISEDYVLTAAHCLQGKRVTTPREPQSLTIYLGRWNLTDDTEENVVKVAAKEFYIHQDWQPFDKRFDADIAIIKLTKSVALGNKIWPICLWNSTLTSDEKHDAGVVVGWGATESQTLGEHSDVPREVILKVKSIFNCYHDEGVREIISPRGLCVGGDGIGPCFGDSGGGLFTSHGSQWYLRGITSASLTSGHTSCDVHSQAVFTNVEMFTEWIDEILNEGEKLQCDFIESGGFYTCRIKRTQTLKILHENTTIWISGQHINNRSDSDIKKLVILREHLKYLPIKLGEHFPNLEKYEINSSGVERISRRNFEDLAKLKFLRITDGSLAKVPNETFYDLIELLNLNLSNNQIKELDHETFIHNSNLKVVNLSGNKIKFLDRQLFRTNLKMVKLVMSSNLLTYIDPELLPSLEHLEDFDFRNNTCIDMGFGDAFRSQHFYTKQDLVRLIATDCQKV